MRSLGIAFVISLVGTACGGMYDAPAQKLARVAVVPHEDIPEEKVKLTYLEECNEPSGPKSSAKKVPTTVSRNTDAAAKAVETGDQRLVEAAKAATIDEKKDLILASIAAYMRALDRDPYDAAATLKLALAYHKVQRKGCALVMLRRLDKLSSHPTFQQAADDAKQEVYNHSTWFADYRPEALKAIP
jgi:hypothetical protein